MRHYFNLRHKGRNVWWILAGAAFGVLALAILIRPDRRARGAGRGAGAGFAQVQAIVEQRCVPCHSLHPTQPGFSAPGAGILLDTREQIEAQANLIRSSRGRHADDAARERDADDRRGARDARDWIASR